METLNNKKKKRLIVKKGPENIALSVMDIALLYTIDRSVCILDKSGCEYQFHKSLSQVHEELEESMFFRANRQQIVNINFIKGFRVYEHVKLSVELTLTHTDQPIIISQDTAPVFKKWLCES